MNENKMDQNVKTKDEKMKTKRGKNFYVALGICLMAISVAIYSTYTSFKYFTHPSQSNEFSISSSQDVFPKDADISSEGSIAEQTQKYKDIIENIRKEQTEKIDANVKSGETEVAIPTKAYLKGTIVLPAGKEVVKKYSGEIPVYSKTFNDWRIHNGIDFSLPLGSKVCAITDGTVKDIFTDPMNGTTVIIDHDGNFTAIYSGLGKTTMVNVGDAIENGTEIGSVGSMPSESLDGDHLHLSIKKGDTYIDPLEVLGKIEWVVIKIIFLPLFYF